MYAFPPEISSFFGKSLPFPFPYFVLFILSFPRVQYLEGIYWLQVNLYTLLQKFNAQTEKEYKTYKENFMKRFEITDLPPYLILYIKVSMDGKNIQGD